MAFLLDRSTTLNLWLGIILFIVVFLTCIMSYWQERKTSKLMDLFGNMAPDDATVIRNGRERAIVVADLVPGDVICVKAGDLVPADARLLQVTGLQVECSSLTGESVPISGSIEAAVEDMPPHESRCLVFSSSLCLQGTALALVLRTGDNTMIGQIAHVTTNVGATQTTLEKEINHFVRFVAVLAISMAAVFFCIGVGRQKGDNALSLFINGFLIVIVANVPQGLPATVTSLLTITARRMAAANVFVKRLDAIETLGSASVICSDKTGTITQNRMTTRELWCNDTVVARDVQQVLSQFTDNILDDDVPGSARGLHWLLNVAVMCNRAVHVDEQSVSTTKIQVTTSRTDHVSSVMSLTNLAAEHEYLGNPSDIALLRFVDDHYDSDAARARYRTVFEVPFNSTNKWQLVVCQPLTVGARLSNQVLSPLVPNDATTSQIKDVALVLMIKGAPEVLLGMCDWVLEHGEIHPMDDVFRHRFNKAVLRFGSQGRRVIGFGAQLLTTVAPTHMTEDSVPRKGYTFLGLASLADPPRENVAAAVAQCRSAGIRVYMVTGDHATTADAIAKEVGILTAQDLAEHRATHGTRDVPGMLSPGIFRSSFVETFSEEDWQYVLSLPGGVFSRATPQQKLTIVRACQQQGEIVAVTGDGVNDAPALKQADIGIAMGLKGNAVAREAAEVLLMDDNFASIINGVLQGRLIIDNLRKTIRYVLSHLMPEIFPVLLTLSCGLPLGLTSLQVLSIDLGTEMAAAITLAYEPAEPGIMARRPRRRNERLVTTELLIYSYLVAGTIETLGCFLAYMQVYNAHGLSLSDIFLQGDNHFRPDPDPLCFGDGRCFTPEEQELIAGQATSAWYVTLIMSQVVHIWMVKSSTVSVFRLSPLNNAVTIYGVVVEILIMLVLVYVPSVQEFMGARALQAQSWPFFLGVSIVLLIFTESYLAYTRSQASATKTLITEDRVAIQAQPSVFQQSRRTMSAV